MVDSDASSAEAFEHLRMEVALLRRAVEAFVAERAGAPDYSPTLEALRREVQVTGQVVQAMGQSPALRTSMYSLNNQLDEMRKLAASKARQEWSLAVDQLQQAARGVEQIIGTARTQDAQSKGLIAAGVMGIVIGAMFCAVFLNLFS